MRILRDEPLKKHTSFKIGGPADYFCIPKNLGDLIEALAFARERKIPFAIMGAGTNLLALDSGFRGLVIKLGNGLNWIKVRGRMVYVGSGVLIPRLLNILQRKSLGGLEFLAGIPGTIGGAVIMNAGAWGKEIGKYVKSVKVLDGLGKERTIEGKKLKFGYRKSLLQKGNLIVTEVVLRLRKSRPKTVRNKIKKYLEQRKKTQPLGIPNAGCIFKNPSGKFAGKILEEAGCKGMRVGDAQVSTKHANFIVNLGEARARDVLRLMTKMQKLAKIKLEPEIKVMIKSQL